MIKKSLSVLVLVFMALLANAQQTTVLSNSYKPALTAETPEWFKVFYGDESQIDLSVLDQKASLYIAAYKEKQKLAIAKEKNVKKLSKNVFATESEEFEMKDKYIRFYLRWRAASQDYINNGKVAFLSPEQLALKAKEDNNRVQSIRKPKAVAKGAANWVPIGPFVNYSHNDSVNMRNYNTNIYTVAMAPSNPNILYAGNETGALFKTTNKGLSWTLIGRNQNLGGSAAIAIAVHPFNPDSVYISKGGKIIFSADGGANFKLLASGVPAEKILINPKTPSKMLVAVDGAIKSSLNGGATWFSRLSTCGWATDIRYNPLNPNTVYAVAQNSTKTKTLLYKSYDAGQNWVSKSANGFSDSLGTGGGMVALSAADTNRVYVCYLAKNFPILNISKDGGETWTYKVASGTGLWGNTGRVFGMSNGQGFYDFVLEASQTNPDELITGTCVVWKSYDGGQSFKSFGGYANESGQSFSIHPDIQACITNGSDTWLATDGGLVYSSDFFTTAANSPVRQDGINGCNFWGFDVGWNEDMVVGGSYHNGNNVASPTEYGHKGLSMGGGESPTGYLFPGRRRHAAFDDIGAYILPEKVGTGNQGGFTLSMYPNQDANQYGESNLLVHPVYYNTLFLGKDSAIYKSTDGGATFSVLYKFNSKVIRFAISRKNPDVMYVGKDMTTGNESLMKTTDGGVSWTKVSLPTTNTGISGGRLYLDIHPDDENKLWISDKDNADAATSTRGKIYYSTNGGTTWLDVTPKTELANRSIRYICSDGGDGVYVASSTGPEFGTGVSILYSAKGDGTDWVDHSDGIPKNLQIMRMKPFFKEGKLRIGSNNIAAWEANLVNTNPKPYAQPLIEKNTINCFRDSVQLESFSIVNQNGCTWEWSVTPATAGFSNPNIRNPKIGFSALGNYAITLKVTNSLGETHTKTITNAVSVAANLCKDAEQVAGKAMQFTNNTQYLQQTGSISIPSTNTTTTMAWIKRNGTQADFTGLVFWRNGMGATGINLRSSGYLAFHWNDMAESYNFNSGLLVPNNAWTHVALVTDATGATLYVNGMPAKMTYANLPKLTFGAPMTIGRDPVNVNRNFVGDIDEVCFYNRALSTEEIRTYMHLTKNNKTPGMLPPVDGSLKSYYQFNETDATICKDAGGSIDLSIVGSPARVTSTVPVGGGTAENINVTTGGTYNFAKPSVDISFPTAAGSTYPNGNVVVSKLLVKPDTMPSANMLPSNPKSYYIVRSFGNQSFTALTGLRFKGVYGVTDSLTQFPNYASLYRRIAAGFGNSWINIDAADTITNTNTFGDVHFSTGLNITTFGQYSIGVTGTSIVPNNMVFNAYKLGSSKVGLTVDLQTTTNILKLTVQRAVGSANNFTDIGYMYSFNGQLVSFTDNKPMLGKNYYRVKVDYADGKVEYSNIKEVALDKLLAIDVKLSPNPTKNGMVALTVDGLTENKNITCEVFTINGKLVKSAKFFGVSNNTSNQLEVSLTNGTYLVKTTLHTGETVTQKVIVAK